MLYTRGILVGKRVKIKYGGSSKFRPGIKPAGSGRKKGTPNKFTTLKQSFLEAFNGLGGTRGLIKWARRKNYNRAHFYAMVAKMLPKEMLINSDDSPEKLPFTVVIAKETKSK